MLHGKGIHDLFHRRIDTPHERDPLHERFTVLNDILADIVRGEDADEKHDEYQRDDPKAGEPQTQKISGQIAQHVVNDSEKTRQHIIRRPDRYDHQKPGNKIFFKEISEFFHVVILLILLSCCKLFFRKEKEQEGKNRPSQNRKARCIIDESYGSQNGNGIISMVTLVSSPVRRSAIAGIAIALNNLFDPCIGDDDQPIASTP
jgi:hypothetical protein